MSTIFNPAGVQVGKGKDLNIVYRKAKEYGGVARITIRRKEFGDRPGVYWGEVKVYYTNGYYAITDFVDYGHAIEWAQDRSKGSKASWFTGCVVDFNLFI